MWLKMQIPKSVQLRRCLRLLSCVRILKVHAQVCAFDCVNTEIGCALKNPYRGILELGSETQKEPDQLFRVSDEQSHLLQGQLLQASSSDDDDKHLGKDILI
jgi:hypothetical protein